VQKRDVQKPARRKKETDRGRSPPRRLPRAPARRLKLRHEISNLLAIIVGNLDLVAQSSRGHPELEEVAREALEAALRMTTLADELLAPGRDTAKAPAKRRR
jgi:signal transduction histidine kinase